MTTRRAIIRREQANEWPAFHGLALPDKLGVLSLEVSCSPDQAIDRAVEEASGVLAASLGALASEHQHKLWFVAASEPFHRPTRVAAYRARRDRVWGVLERRGVVLPSGSRRDLVISLPDDAIGLVGIIELSDNDPRVALNATRTINAVCLASVPGVTDPLSVIVPDNPDCIGVNKRGLLAASVRLHGRWSFVSKAFGEFDDYVVGVNVLAESLLLDILEPIAVAVAARSSDDYPQQSH